MIKKTLFPLAFVLCVFSSACADIKLESEKVWNQYDRYKEQAIKDRFFKHSDIIPLIKKHSESKLFQHEILGYSVQGRSINHLTIGAGKIKVLLWSQMHGDESTATMALFDVFNFLTARDENDSLRNFLLENLELHFVPMLNPDGAEVWKRRNAMDIDINRDARLQATPEGKLLKSVAQRLKPHFGFNLHDQSRYYAAGPFPHQATISFLAPAYNYKREMNEVRNKASQIILTMNKMLQAHIPNKIAKYNDAYDPRCFGDTFQGMGISTILIESGGYPQDPEKQYIRRLNFYALISAFETIARQAYEQEDLDDYKSIPENNKGFYDLIVRNVMVEKAGKIFKTHLAINHNQILNKDFRGVSYKGIIEEMSDLDRNYGYEEADAKSLKYIAGKVKSLTQEEWDKLTPEDEFQLIKQGFLFVRLTDTQSPTGAIPGRLLNLTNSNNPTQTVGLGETANFLLSDNIQPLYAVINGYWVDLSQPPKVLRNTMAY